MVQYHLDFRIINVPVIWGYQTSRDCVLPGAPQCHHLFYFARFRLFLLLWVGTAFQVESFSKRDGDV